MSERPRFFDDLAGVAGGAISALAGLREEAEALVRARIDETIRRLDLVRREELDAMPGAGRQRAGRPGGGRGAAARSRVGERARRAGSAGVPRHWRRTKRRGSEACGAAARGVG